MPAIDPYIDPYVDMYGSFMFGASPLGAQVELDLAGIWTDITAYAVHDNRAAAVITRGRPNAAQTATPSGCAMRWNNADGRFSQRNPSGPFYGTLNRNTPVRVSVPYSATYLRFEDDSASYASATVTPPPGDFEARIDLELSNWTASVLVSQWDAHADWALVLNADGTLSFLMTPDGITQFTATSTQPLPWPGGRFTIRLTFTSATGTVAFYTAPSINPASWAQLGLTVACGHAGPVYSGAATVKVGANPLLTNANAAFSGYQGIFGAPAGVAWAPEGWNGMNGKVYEVQVLNGIGGPFLADPRFWAQAPGAASFADAQGNTWSLSGTAAVTGRDYRFHGEAAALPQTWDVTGHDVWTPVTASGLLRRAQQGTPPVTSSMTRGFQRRTGALAPLAYWPCEDGDSAGGSSNPDITQIASGLPGGQPMIFTQGTPSFASNSDFGCSQAIPSTNGAVWWGTVPTYTPGASPAAITRFLYEPPSGGDTDTGVVMRVHTTGTIWRLDLEYGVVNNGSLQLVGFDGLGNQLFASGFMDVVPNFGGQNGVPVYVSVELQTSGGNINWAFWVFQPASSVTGIGLTGSIAGTVGAATHIGVNPKTSKLLTSTAVGQISFQNQWESVFSGVVAGPLNAWAGETAGLRFARICAEEGYQARIIGPAAQSVMMGQQAPDTVVNWLTSCEGADHGMVCESRDSLSLRYRTLASMCAQAPKLSLDYTQDHLSPPLTPVDDDQLTINDVVATRQSGTTVTGSSYETMLDSRALYAATAALSTQPPPNGVGDYQSGPQVNVLFDTQLPDQAGWLVHLGTVDEPRFPVVTADLASTDLIGLFYSYTGTDLGDYIATAKPPSFLQADALKMIAWGLTEEIGNKKFLITWQTLPESPYEVLVWGTGAATDCRFDTDGSTLNAAVNATATTLTVATTSASTPLWTTAAGDFPFDIVIGGERMTVTNIIGAASPQTFTVTRSVNGVVKAQAANAPVNLFQPCYLALA